MDAKLIGYDETPIDNTPCDDTDLENLSLQEPSGSDFNPKTHFISKLSDACSPCFIAANKLAPPSSAQPRETVACPKSDLDLPTTGMSWLCYLQI